MVIRRMIAVIPIMMGGMEAVLTVLGEENPEAVAQAEMGINQ